MVKQAALRWLRIILSGLVSSAIVADSYSLAQNSSTLGVNGTLRYSLHDENDPIWWWNTNKNSIDQISYNESLLSSGQVRMNNHRSVVRAQIVVRTEELERFVSIQTGSGQVEEFVDRKLRVEPIGTIKTDEDQTSHLFPARNVAILLPDAVAPATGVYQHFCDVRPIFVYPDRFEPRVVQVRRGFSCVRLVPCSLPEEMRIRRDWIVYTGGVSLSGNPVVERVKVDRIPGVETEVFCANGIQTPVAGRVSHAVPPVPWATMLVADYASVVDVDGIVEIVGLESGRKLKFQLYHPDLKTNFEGTRVSTQNDQGVITNQVLTNDGSFELSLRDGINYIHRIDITDTIIKHLENPPEAKPHGTTSVEDQKWQTRLADNLNQRKENTPEKLEMSPDEKTLAEKTHREFRRWLAREESLRPQRMSNQQAHFRVRFTYSSVPGMPELSKTDFADSIRFPIRDFKESEPNLREANNRNIIVPEALTAWVKNCAIYLPGRLGPSRGFGIPESRIDRIRYIRIFDDRFEPEIVSIDPNSEVVKLFGQGQSLNESTVKRLRIVASSATRVWPGVDSVVELDGVDPRPTLIEDINNVSRRAYVVPQFYSSISDSLGKVEIHGIEADTKLRFCFFHPVLMNDFTGVKIAAEEIGKDGEIELSLSPGLNDFGNIDLSPAINRYLGKRENPESQK